MATLSGTAVSIELYGGILDVDGAGHFPGLELINLIVCGTDGILPIPSFGKIHLKRETHDFARRLVTEKLISSERDKVLLGAHSADAVTHLLKCLELNKNSINAKTWSRTHFFPYTRSLVHWDGRDRKNTELERTYLRGGGALAHSILRNDPDSVRLANIREGFKDIYPDSKDTPLERVAATLLSHGFKDTVPVQDLVEPRSIIFNDKLEELYRFGVNNILSYKQLPPVQRIRTLMDWTGIWLVIMQANRSFSYLENQKSFFIIDCAGAHPQLRRASQKNLKDHISFIENAVEKLAKTKDGVLGKHHFGKIRGFFASTAWTCGMLNSFKGKRHFTFRLQAIEALVMAAVGQGDEITFEGFTTDWLGDRCGLIVGREAAASAELLNRFDASIFEENERQFAEQMKATGMLSVFSDATRMVSGDPR